MLLSLHIPKTGGSTFRQLLEQQFGGGLVLDYGDRPLSHGYAWRRIKARALGRDRLPADAACVHGHFLAGKYRRRYPQASWAVWMRDPVERAISHYLHWKRHPNPKNSACRALMERDFAFEAFVELAPLRNIHKRFMDGMEPEDFVFLGVTEHYAQSLALLCRMKGWEAQAPEPQNRRPETGEEITRAQRQRLAQAHAEDIALYRRGLAHFEKLCREHGL